MIAHISLGGRVPVTISYNAFAGDASAPYPRVDVARPVVMHEGLVSAEVSYSIQSISGHLIRHSLESRLRLGRHCGVRLVSHEI